MPTRITRPPCIVGISDERFKDDFRGVWKVRPHYLHSRGLFRPNTAPVSNLAESTTREALRDVGSDDLPTLIIINSMSCTSALGRDKKGKMTLPQG
ncbi:hypothetical protein PoB_005115500 [Plakobranchus ocellatus]|uniref:Uncharacterized protein n=1 Tax=Plakobranchus ocellatus TaxID=259542 RepID=A0AAV4BZ99_9GAST|nr:hypothetical protein PoB_005115500 [Plakobranchus ocellatus]